MLDDLHSDGRSEGPRRTNDSVRPASDREVPLGQPAAVIADGVHRWLDGEATESSARRCPGGQDVEFWKRLEGDLQRCRQVRAPEGLVARIMAAIP